MNEQKIRQEHSFQKSRNVGKKHLFLSMTDGKMMVIVGMHFVASEERRRRMKKHESLKMTLGMKAEISRELEKT